MFSWRLWIWPPKSDDSVNDRRPHCVQQCLLLFQGCRDLHVYVVLLQPGAAHAQGSMNGMNHYSFSCSTLSTKQTRQEDSRTTDKRLMCCINDKIKAAATLLRPPHHSLEEVPSLTVVGSWYIFWLPPSSSFCTQNTHTQVLHLLFSFLPSLCCHISTTYCLDGLFLADKDQVKGCCCSRYKASFPQSHRSLSSKDGEPANCLKWNLPLM